VDNRHVIFVGPDSSIGLNRLGVIVFDQPLTNLPHTSLIPSSTIAFTGFKSDETLQNLNEQYRFIRTAPDFPNLIILGGFKQGYFSVFKITQNQLVFINNILFV
jgi:hypothetical protein